MDKARKNSRKEQILQTLAYMLETSPGERITTSSLAKAVGVSEAALYRHFPSKAKMFEGLIEFIEEALFSRIKVILDKSENAIEQCGNILSSLLLFCEKNTGLTRLLMGDALAGETDRLRQRIAKIFEKLELQIQQILQQYERISGRLSDLPVNIVANLFLAAAEGRISQYVRSEFKKKPTYKWQEQWRIVSASYFVK